MTEERIAAYPIDPQFVSRWSPRAFDGRAMTFEQLAPLFEAARWAPSCLNSQPWRFVYALRDGPSWANFLSWLTASNQVWARNASALIYLAAHKRMRAPGRDDPIPSPTYAFDAGAAWALLALQARMSGMHTRGMAGFDHERAARELGFSADYEMQAAIAVGWIADKSILPETLQGRESPTNRTPIAAFAFSGRFGGEPSS